jgi:hypothetical protein
MVKKVIQSCPELCRRKGHSHFDARSVLPVREHDKIATCLREALRRRQGTPLVAFFNIPLCEMVARRTDAVSDKLTSQKDGTSKR